MTIEERRAPRLCLLTQYFPPEMGAPQVRLSELGARLATSGWDVEVLSALPNYPRGKVFPGYRRWSVDIGESNGMRVVRVPLLPSNHGTAGRLLTYFSFVVTASLLGPMRCQAPDLLFAESPPLTVALATRWLAWRWRCPYVFNVSDLWPASAVHMGVLEPGAIVDAAEKLERSTYRRAAGVTGQSEEIVAAVTAVAPEVPSEVITNGVDPNRFGPGLVDDAARAVLDADGKFCFVYAGLLGLAQGLDQVLDTAASLPPTSNAVFRIVGTGPVRDQLAARIETEGIDRVKLLGELPRDRIPAVLGAADAAIITLGLNLPGAVPSKIYEAMASQLPILLVAEGEAARRVDAAGCGVVVSPNDPDALREAILRLEGDPTQRHRMGEAGRRAAETTYDRNRIADTLDRFLRDRIKPDERSRLARVYQAYDGVREHAWSDDNPGNLAAVAKRDAIVSDALTRAHIDTAEARALDLGCGPGGGLRMLQHLGVRTDHAVGADLLAERLLAIPHNRRESTLLAADGRFLPFASRSFDLVVASTLFSSVLDDAIARAVASEIDRVLRPGGAVIWYDIRVPNPRNKHVRPYSTARIRSLFPGFHADVRATTVLPGLARRLGGSTGQVYPLAHRVPVLRTHLAGVVAKPEI